MGTKMWLSTSISFRLRCLFVAHVEAIVGRFSYIQFSNFNFLILSNSLVLFVTRIKSFEIACAAICISYDPITCPLFSNSALIIPNTSASLSSKGKISKPETKPTRAFLFRSLFLLLDTPYSSSPIDITDNFTCEGLSCFIFSTTVLGLLFIMYMQIFVSSKYIITLLFLEQAADSSHLP